MSRSGSVTRNTAETKIEASLDLDGRGRAEVHTGIGFLDHLLVLLSRHSAIDIVLSASGDVEVFTDEYVFIGQDPASGAGTATGLDATETYDLTTKLAPYVADGNANQGIHVRLTVRAQGSIGADVKSKTFWAQGCEGPEPPPS